MVLFNLYAFDQVRGTRLATPMLNISNCEFYYLMNSYDSLIYLENNNFYSDDNSGSSGAIYYFGDSRGMNLNIDSSIFKNSRFC